VQTVTEPITDAAALRAAITRCRIAVERHRRALTRLDDVLGDGDHGDNLVIGFRAAELHVSELPQETRPGELLRAVGHRLVGAVGGASGPLYGTAFIEAGFAAGGATTIGGPTIAAMLAAAAAGLARRGRCSVGDKTILDTLQPGMRAFVDAIDRGSTVGEAAGAMLTAAAAGMRSTRPLVARRGLALRLGPRSAGHLDPGAVSCFVLLRALVER
jgi:dihydroxyacetone kinase-like protein